MDALASPHRDALTEAVEAAYLMRPDRVTGDLDVCLRCLGCELDGRYVPGEEILPRIVGTPPRLLSSELLRCLSEGLHGAPQSRRNLRALLPRYLEAIARDEAVDTMEIGVELSEFGSAMRNDPGFVDGPERAFLDRWMESFLRHSAWCDGIGAAVRHPPAYAVPMLIAGGWRARQVLPVLEAALDDPATGLRAAGRFAEAIERCAWRRKDPVSGLRDGAAGLGWVPMLYTDDVDRGAVAEWLNGERFGAITERVALSDLPYEQASAASILHDTIGDFDPRCLGDEWSVKRAFEDAP